MILIGGITRLTESGLSMVEWKLLMGAIPPISEEAWQEKFEQYQEYPQYNISYPDMTLGEFKAIYWWEYIHRLWGRLLGFVVLVPFLWFWIRGILTRADVGKLGIAILLGVSQAALGWFMVKSGLVDRPAVSGYRLTAHFLLAVGLIGYLLWLTMDAWLPKGSRASDSDQEPKWFKPLAWSFVGLLAVQLGLGALMAGTRAALAYPSFPTMNGQWWPNGIMALEPWWSNFFENPTTIQLVHRILAIAVTVLALFVSVAACKMLRLRSAWAAYAPVVLCSVQVALGVWTVIGSRTEVPLVPGVLHQAVGVVLFAAALYLLHPLSRPATDP